MTAGDGNENTFRTATDLADGAVDPAGAGGMTAWTGPGVGAAWVGGAVVAAPSGASATRVTDPESVPQPATATATTTVAAAVASRRRATTPTIDAAARSHRGFTE